MELSPDWRSRMYSIASGEQGSEWLYGTKFTLMSVTVSGTGQSSRVIPCQQLGLPRKATLSVGPGEIFQVYVRVGRFDNGT